MLVTANDYGLRLYNGDTGVTVLRDGVLRAVIAGPPEPLEFATSRLADVETMHAMTIHKSQGSQADEVTVLMPPEDSRLLTRELFYTAVTRAKKQGPGGRSRGVGAGRDRAPGGARVGSGASPAGQLNKTSCRALSPGLGSSHFRASVPGDCDVAHTTGWTEPAMSTENIETWPALADATLSLCC